MAPRRSFRHGSITTPFKTFACLTQVPDSESNNENTPQWLLDAASDMAAGGAVASNAAGGTAGVFGASTGTVFSVN